MVHGETKNHDARAADEQDETPARPIVFGKLKTDEEARLAREIEKLRGLPPRTEDDEDA